MEDCRKVLEGEMTAFYSQTLARVADSPMLIVGLASQGTSELLVITTNAAFHNEHFHPSRILLLGDAIQWQHALVDPAKVPSPIFQSWSECGPSICCKYIRMCWERYRSINWTVYHRIAFIPNMWIGHMLECI